MTDTLEIFGTEYSGVTGIKATDDNNNILTYIRPQGTKSITSSGTTDVTEFASASVASGTAGTPTASKGTVTNHSVSVTPSVTNTTGYITGSTKTGTAVTVSASELVSGSETKTSNGTYDVTNLASLVVNVSGGSGLVSETGTYKPTTDIARPTISFSKTYAKPPAIVMLSDATGTIDTTANTNYAFTFSDYYQLTGCGYPYSSSDYRYCLAKSLYKGSTGTGNTTNNTVYVTYNYTSQTSTYTSAYSRYWVTESGFSPYSNSTSRYWRTTRTYKWIAIWI